MIISNYKFDFNQDNSDTIDIYVTVHNANEKRNINITVLCAVIACPIYIYILILYLIYNSVGVQKNPDYTICEFYKLISVKKKFQEKRKDKKRTCYLKIINSMFV